jgi:hypothetical protein
LAFLLSDAAEHVQYFHFATHKPKVSPNLENLDHHNESFVPKEVSVLE